MSAGIILKWTLLLGKLVSIWLTLTWLFAIWFTSITLFLIPFWVFSTFYKIFGLGELNLIRLFTLRALLDLINLLSKLFYMLYYCILVWASWRTILGWIWLWNKWRGVGPITADLKAWLFLFTPRRLKNSLDGSDSLNWLVCFEAAKL